METKTVKRIPLRAGVDLVIYTCPHCGHRCWEYVAISLNPKDVPCPLCGRPVV